MAKYRKKPSFVDAFQLTQPNRDSNELWPDWALQAWNKSMDEVGALSASKPGEKNADIHGPIYIVTNDASTPVNINDWVVQDAAGNLTACDPEKFARTYDLVN